MVKLSKRFKTIEEQKEYYRLYYIKNKHRWKDYRRRGKNSSRGKWRRVVWAECVKKSPNGIVDITSFLYALDEYKNRRRLRKLRLKNNRYKCNGYIRVRLHKSSPYYSMVDRCGFVMEHRLIMAQRLDRCLSNDEIVHHKNRIKSDNRLENLELTRLGEHIIKHNEGFLEGYILGCQEAINTIYNGNP